MIVEIVLILLLLAMTGRGWRNGLVESLGELVGAVLAFVVVRGASPLFGAGSSRLIAFIVIALFVTWLVGWLFDMADKVLRIVTRLPLINMAQKAIGAILGFLSGVVLVGSTTYIILLYRLEPRMVGWLAGSTVAHWCERAFSTVLRFLL